MNLRWTRYFFILIALLSIVACSDGEATSNEKDVQETMKQQEEQRNVVEYPPAARTPEKIAQQPVGQKINTSLDQAEIKNIMTEFEAEGMTSEQIYDGLVHWFGFDYKRAYEELRDFEPDFGELDITKEQESKVKNIAIHLDSSGSMAGQVSGGVKMELAKDALKKYAAGLPEESIISLRVYGHKGTGSNQDRSLSCSSTEVMFEANTYNETTFSGALEKFKPSGWTPLAASIQKAYEDLKTNASPTTENILFVVSDGIETCEGNPVEEALKLAESDLNVKVNIIGFNVDDAGQKQLKETAEAGNGEYFTVNSNIDFTNTIEQMLQDARKGYEKNFEKAGLSTKINFRVPEISREITKLGSNFAEVFENESSILSDALYELYQQEKITSEVNDGVNLMIIQRYDQLNQFKEELLQQANEKKEQKHEELLTLIRNS